MAIKIFLYLVKRKYRITFLMSAILINQDTPDYSILLHPINYLLTVMSALYYMVSHRGHNCISSTLTVLDSALIS